MSINLHRDTIVSRVGVTNETSGIKVESSSTSMSIGSGTVSGCGWLNSSVPCVGAPSLDRLIPRGIEM